MTADRKALDRWARDAGWANFDTYIRVGGSVIDARRAIADRISALEHALRALDSHTAAAFDRAHDSHAAIGEISPAEPDDPPDPHNAHPQGAEQ